MVRDILITNNLSGKKEPLITVDKGRVKMYACGVTTYDHCHIGHAMQAIFFEVIRNYLEFAGYHVTYVRNYTDVDDKIIKRAEEQGINPKTLAEAIIESSKSDMEALGIRPADHEPKVSETIDEIIKMTQTLVEKGAAYPTPGGDVYYKVKSKNDYGKLSNRDPKELRSGTREIIEDGKQDSIDFALWKKDSTPGASWESPWGLGRPGWHIECSAMAKKFLGSEFDIHGGGRDLIFPHHENEIAQSESANSCNYARNWIHSGLLTINKQKMSKSLGNHISIKEFLNKWPGEVLKLAYLQHHYSSNIDFSQKVFQNCAKRLLFFYETMKTLEQIASKSSIQGSLLEKYPNRLEEEFHTSMSNDFGTPAALRDIIKYFKKAGELGSEKKSPQKNFTAKSYLTTLKKVCGVLGIMQREPEAFIDELKSKVLPTLGITETEIQAMITRRKEARANKNFAESDAIREELAAKGVAIMDTPGGTSWKLVFIEE